MAVEVFIAAGRPLGDGLVVVHDSANVGAGSALAVVTRVSRRVSEVMFHAGVVANLMRHDLNRHWKYADYYTLF